MERITVSSQKHYLICPFSEKRHIQIERNHIKPFIHTGSFQFLCWVVSSHHFLHTPYIKLFGLLFHNQAYDDAQAWKTEPGAIILCMRQFAKAKFMNKLDSRFKKMLFDSIPLLTTAIGETILKTSEVLL